jgi:hypothetical protein
MNNYFLLDFHDLHSNDCPYTTQKTTPKRRGRPPLPKHIKEVKKEEHKEYMREYQRRQREALSEEEKEELNRKAKEHYHKHKEDIKMKKKEIHSLSRDATYVLRDLYLMGNIIPMRQEQKNILDKFFNLPFKNI